MAWIDSAGHCLTAAEPSTGELAPLAARLAGARVVGIGESTRGTHEDQAFKAALIRALVRAGAVYALALEATQAGIGLPDEVARARLELNNVLADLANARRQRTDLEKNLALLCGQPSPDFHLPVRPLEHAVPPVQPRQVPAGLLTRRPDVAASQRRLAATLQDTRQAKAEERPRITVGGHVGQMSTDAEHFADRKSHEASIMPVISLPVFEGGRLDANVKLAQARRDEAAANYKEAVLTAFREADKTLHQEVTDYPGFHTRPMGWEQVKAKFDRLTKPFMDEATGGALCAVVHDLENRPGSALIEQTLKARPVA